MSEKLLGIAFEPSEAPACSAFAKALGLPLDILSLQGDASAACERLIQAGLPQIPPADGLAEAIAMLCSGFSHIAAPSSMSSKDVLARLAGILQAAMVTDVIGLESPTVFRRPIAAGAAIALVETLSQPVVCTFRASAFPPTDSGLPASVQSVQLAIEERTRRIGSSGASGQRPDLAQAKVVVSGGRPLRDAETFERLIGGLADKLGGAAGATRAAVDSGIAPNELQVGQTGKVVAPDLYIAAGISGSTQHMAGIKDSKLIVAINKDPDAPIFEFSDLGLVADLYEVLPELTKRLGG